MFVAVATMGTDVYQFNQRNVGTRKIEPWLSRAGKAIRSFATGLVDAIARALSGREALAGAALVALFMATGANADPASIGFGLAITGTVAEPTLADVKSAIDGNNRAFAEFKNAQEAINRELKEKGVADPLLKSKVDTLTEAMDKFSDVNEKFMETRLIVDRLASAGLSSEGKHIDRNEARSQFNLTLKARGVEKGVHVVELDDAGFKAYESGFDAYLRRGDRSLTPEQMKAMSVGGDPGGGYTVTPDASGRIVKRIYETSPIAQYASNQQISTDALEGTFDLDEATAGWVSELGTRSVDSTNPVPAVPWRIPAHEAYAQPKLSTKLIEDSSIDIVGWHSMKSGDRIARLFNAAWCVGNGVGKPRGFGAYTTAATADATRAWGEFEHILSGANGAFAADPASVQKLNTLIHLPKDHFLAKAAFYMNRTTLGYTRGTTDASSAGKFVFIPSMQAGMPDTIMGYPVRRLQDMATYSTTGALAIAFGDMEAAYQIVTRRGIVVLYDPFTAKPYVVLYTTARVGGGALDFEALKFIKFSA
jgi:HK97 family phage major capsid protein